MLEVQDLQTHFRTKSGFVRAVDGIGFTVHAGEKVAIVGESGCGKSVTALSLMRLVSQPPGEYVNGRIFFEDQDLLSLSESEMRRIRGARISMIFQDPMTSLNPTMPVTEQIAEALRLHLKLSPTAARKRTEELLEQVGIAVSPERRRAYPHQYSGGMRQRVMIAMALACKPRLLIADEPTTALDVTVQAQILELIESICQDSGTSLILITHDLGVVAGVADRVIVMYAGKIVEEASTEELFSNPRHPYTAGLLGSVPRLDEARQPTLRTIEGSPPDLLRPPAGCRFLQRCLFAKEKCRTPPPLIALSTIQNHTHACWFDITDPKEQAYAERRRLARLAAQESILQAAGRHKTDGGES